MLKAVYPGTFDPITKGHIDIISRACNIFDRIVVGVFRNPSKHTFFSYQERIEITKNSLRNFDKVDVIGFEGLVVNFAREIKAKVIIRGLRMISDFEYEFQMALTNRKLADDIETVFLMPHPDYSFISSKLVKEAFFLGADLKQFLPLSSIEALNRKKNENRSR